MHSGLSEMDFFFLGALKMSRWRDDRYQQASRQDAHPPYLTGNIGSSPSANLHQIQEGDASSSTTRQGPIPPPWQQGREHLPKRQKGWIPETNKGTASAGCLSLQISTRKTSEGRVQRYRRTQAQLPPIDYKATRSLSLKGHNRNTIMN